MASKQELIAHADLEKAKRRLALIKQIRKMMPQIGMAMLLLLNTGCQLCCPPYMDDYATVGGKWARSHPSEGVIGSAFSDPSSTQIFRDEGHIVLPQESLSYGHPLPLEMQESEPSGADSTYFEDDSSSIIVLE